MGNALPDKLTTGTLGEIFVQLRLLEYGIQAAPPIKDTGNDLIAIKGEVVKYIQVKTSKKRRPAIPRTKLPEIYHYVALVKLKFSQDGSLLIDKSVFWLISKQEIDANVKVDNNNVLTKSLADNIWQTSNNG